MSTFYITKISTYISELEEHSMYCSAPAILFFLISELTNIKIQLILQELWTKLYQKKENVILEKFCRNIKLQTYIKIGKKNMKIKGLIWIEDKA